MEWKFNHKGYAIYIGSDRVYFESITLGEDDSICVYHDNKRNCFDYDMAFGMLDEAREWLDSNGYKTDEILG